MILRLVLEVKLPCELLGTFWSRGIFFLQLTPMYCTLLNILPLESKGKNFITFVYGIRLLNLEERCPLREDLALHFRENYLKEVKIPLPMEEFTSNC